MNTFDTYPSERQVSAVRDSIYDPVARIVVLGIGGAGNNAVNRMIEDGVKGVEFVGINTDTQDLRHCKASKRISIGEKVTGGRGAGAIPEVGESAANESKESIRSILRETETQKKADMVFITCGMGGGTGTGAAPIIASIAKEEGILTVAVVTKPFRFEGKVRTNRAIAGINKLFPNVDTLITIPNDRLIDVVDAKDGFREAFAKADEVLKQSIKGITDMINLPALVNLDFADVSTVMRGKGLAHIAVGTGTGENKVSEALSKAIESPLLDTTIDGATDIIVSLCGEVTLLDVDSALKEIEPKLSPDVNIIFGAREDANLKDTVSVTLIATGVRDSKNQYPIYQRQTQNSFAQFNQPLNQSFAQPLTQPISQVQPASQKAVTPKFEDMERDSLVNSFFNNKKPTQPKPTESANVGATSSSVSLDSLNVDLSKVGFNNKTRNSKDLLPSFITDSFKH